MDEKVKNIQKNTKPWAEAISQLGTAAQACNPSLLELEAGEPKIPGQPEPHSKTIAWKGVEK